MNFKIILNNRELIFSVLIITILLSFIVSYAISNICVFLLIGFFFLDHKKNILKKVKTICKNKLVITYLLFFLIQMIGSLYSDNKLFAIRKLEIMLPILFLPSILSVERLSTLKFYKILKILKILILGIFTFYLLIHVLIDKNDVNTFLFFTIKDKLKVSQFYLAFILLIPLLQSINELENKKNTIINILTLCLSVFFLFLLGNKTVLFFLFVISLFFLIKNFKQNRKRTVTTLLVLIVASSLSYQMPIINNKVNVIVKTTDFNINTIITKNKFTQTKNTLEHRILINYLSLIEIKNNLPFGVGTGDYMDILLKQYNRVNFKFGKAKKLNNHNQYLEEFLKTGFLGGLIFIYLIYLILKTSSKFDGFGFIIALLFAIACFVESYLNRQHGILIFSFIIPLFLNHKKIPF